MKKRILGMVLCVCMVLSLLTVAAFAEETHTATFLFDHGTLHLGDVTVTDSPYALTFTEADGVTLGSITDCGPYKFVGWREAGSGAGDVYSSGTWTDPYSDVTFEAVYQEPPALAITVDGFEVGNTPADITYSFASTNLGVTFGKDDVAFVGWLKYDDEFDQWESVYDDEQFEAGTRYELYLELNGKGLSELPAVTINGKTPEYCQLSEDRDPKIRMDCEFGTPPEPALAITVDGFEVGNTPKDITYSFASTNLGVTFGKDDVAFVVWLKYDDEFDQWEGVYDDEQFEADTRYQLVLYLNDKGLSELPAVTINGKTPEFCEFATKDPEIRMECEFGTPAEPALAITVDGFEVGNTPEDITLSFASTNLGVTFGKGDVKLVAWNKYVEEFGGWDGVSDDEQFQADKRYQLALELNDKGLSALPAVTINDKTPEYCEFSDSDPWIMMDCVFGTPPEPTLAVTVDGFEVGNTPADCTFSFESTIPGVTFDEEDIEGVAWDGFFSDGDYHWGAISSTTAFQADTAYWLTLSLDNNGLNKLPAITLNGNPVENCELVTNEGEPYAINMGYFFDAPPEPPQYTITYEGGEGVEGSIPAGVKTRGEAFTLSSDTFTREGFVQTGWVDESGAIYDLGGDYMLDEDMTFYPYWEKRITLTVPYTTTVALGDAGEPGETAFDLALVGSGAGDYDAADVTVSGTVMTDGAGDYNGTLAITGPEWTLWHLLSEGAFVQQVDAGADGWTVDDTVWGLLMSQAAALSDDAAAGYTLLVVPASVDEFGNYGIDWNLIDWEDPQSADMTFTNTYTAHAYALNHDADGHWDECAGCGDIQNEEAHKYGDWTVTKEATETAVGEKEHTCTVCGYTETAEIAKLPATTDPTNPDTKPETKPATGTVQTGDEGFLLWAALFVTSGTLLAVLAPDSKRRRSARTK